MQVAWVNPKAPVETKDQHQCNVCKLYFGWRDGDSGYYERLSPNWLGEDYFFLCSEVCHEKALAAGMIDKFYAKGKKK